MRNLLLIADGIFRNGEVPLFLILLTMFYSQGASAQGASACTLDSITNSCSDYDPAIATIQIGNRQVPNLSNWLFNEVQASAPLVANPSLIKSGQRTQTVLIGEALSILDQIPDSVISPRAKQAIAGRGLWDTMLNLDSSPSVVAVPWPLEDPDGKIQLVTAQDFTSALKQKLSKAQYDKLIRLKLDRPLRSGPSARVSVSSAEEARVRGLLEQARPAFLKTVMPLGPQGARLAEKLKSVRIKTGAETNRSFACLSVSSNAAYVPVENTIYVCNGAYDLPDLSLVSIIGHELAHAIDPCYASYEIYSVNTEKLNALLAQDGLSSSFRFDLRRAQGSPEILLQPNPSQKADLERAIAAGALVSHHIAVPRNRYPLQSVAECLESHGVRVPHLRDHRELISRIAASANTEMRDSVLTGGKIAEENLDCRYPEASMFGLPRSQMIEAMSDWFGAVAAADFLAHNPPRDQVAARRDLAAGFAGTYCFQNLSERLEHDQKGRMKAVLHAQIIANQLMAATDEHPPMQDRLEQIFLQNPALRASLGCGPTNMYCQPAVRTGSVDGQGVSSGRSAE